MMYPESKTIFDSFESFDRGVYRVNKWSPEYEFKVGPGQCVIFPPGYMHETFVNPKENDECTVASTFQYNIPFPVKYIRAWLPRLYNSHLVWAEDCHSRWEGSSHFGGVVGWRVASRGGARLWWLLLRSWRGRGGLEGRGARREVHGARL